MRNVLVKGPESAIADTRVDWHEEGNIKNHTHVFIDLMDLQLRAHEFAHPYFDWEDSVKFPSRRDVTEFMIGGNQMVIRLPEELTANFRGEDHDGNEEYYEANLTNWLPFYLVAGDEENGDLVTVVDNNWKWYFGDQFNWEIFLEEVGMLSTFTWSPYSDPRPHQGGPKGMRSPTQDEHGPPFEQDPIAIDNVSRPIASVVHLNGESEGVRPPGTVYLIPEKPDQDFDDFVRSILTHIFNLDLETTPGWIDQYELPNQDQIEQNIEGIESQIESIEREIQKGTNFRRILHDSDDSLENTVREVFRHMAISVDPEKPNHRDGGIPLEDETLILEITGTDGGISHKKISQLDRHMDDAEEEGYGSNRTGLLIVNHYKDRDPEDRPLNTENFRSELEDRGYKLLITTELYTILCAYERGDLTTEDVIDTIVAGNSIIHYSDSLESSNLDIESRVDRVKRRLSQLFPT